MERTDRRTVRLLAGVHRRLLAAYAVHFALVVGLFVAAIVVPQLILVRGGAVSADALRTLYAMHPASWLMGAGVIGIVAFHALITTHRVAGPLVQIHRAAERIAAGDLDQRLQIRKHDYLQAEVDAINGMLDVFAERLDGNVATGREHARRVEEPV